MSPKFEFISIAFDWPLPRHNKPAPQIVESITTETQCIAFTTELELLRWLYLKLYELSSAPLNLQRGILLESLIWSKREYRNSFLMQREEPSWLDRHVQETLDELHSKFGLQSLTKESNTDRNNVPRNP